MTRYVVAALLLSGLLPAATLREAIRAGDLAEVRAALDANAQINQPDDLGATPLHDAVWFGDLPIVQLLLDRGAAVNASHKEGGSTPLHFAALRGTTDLARLLLDHKADPNAANNAGATSLQFAAHRDDAALTTLLLDHGATPTSRDLNESAVSRAFMVTRLLLDHGHYSPADLSAALIAAILRNDDEIATLFLNHHADPDTPTALHRAAGSGFTRVAEALLKSGANPNAVDVNGTPALHEAALKGHAGIIRLLGDKGAQLNTPDPAAGSTPLYAAASMGHLEATRTLLELGADPTLKAKSGRTPKQAAEASGFRDVASMFR